MRKYGLLFLFSGIIVFTGCQKEIDWGLGGSSGGDLLVKTVSKNGTDSVVTVYTYNSSRKLINEKMTGMSQGINAGNEYRYYRNGSGIITHYVQINPNLILAGIDSVVTYVNYDAASSRYTSSVSELSLFGFTVRDSAAIVYSANGKVGQLDQYQKIPLSGGGYEISARIKYTFDASGNMTQQDFYSVDPVTLAEDLFSSIKYTFDTRPSAIRLDNEGFAIGKPDLTSFNNAASVDFVDASDPANNFTISNVYTYNSNNKPATAVSTRNPGAIVNNISYYYQ